MVSEKCYLYLQNFASSHIGGKWSFDYGIHLHENAVYRFGVLQLSTYTIHFDISRPRFLHSQGILEKEIIVILHFINEHHEHNPPCLYHYVDAPYASDVHHA